MGEPRIDPPAHDAAQSLDLTVVVPVKNEARNLPHCLASLPGGVRVLVVDSGSIDATRSIAEASGAEVVDFHWQGGFPKKRNWALATQNILTQWVLFIDADERLTPTFRRDLAAALGRSDVVGYWLNYSNHFMGRVLRHGVAQRKLALFRVGAGRYERIDDAGWSALDMEVHEHPILKGVISSVAAPIDHLDYRGLHHFIGRHNDYSTWEARRYMALRGDAEAWDALTGRQRIKYRSLTRWWFAPAYFVMTYCLRGGVLDGRAGFVYAVLKAFYFMQVRLKIMELTAPPGTKT